MNVSDMVRALKAAGCSPEQIVAAVEQLDETVATRSSVRRQARNARYYEARKARLKTSETVLIKTPKTPSESVLKASETVLIKTPLARVEDNLLTTEISGKEEKNISHRRLNSDAPTPRQILLECLSAESADAVLAHRKAKRCPVTVRAAQLLAKGFTATGDPNAAADMMIERGWQGFKPEWYDNERAGNGQGKGQSRRSVSDVAPSFIKRLDEQFAYLDGPKDRGPDGGPVVQFLPPQRGQRS